MAGTLSSPPPLPVQEPEHKLGKNIAPQSYRALVLPGAAVNDSVTRDCDAIQKAL